MKALVKHSWSAAERRAMDREIKAQLAEYNEKNMREVDATVLWVLHDKFGWGPERLRRFYKEFIECMDELTARYEMDKDEVPWLCTYKLKDYGIDLEEWEKEFY